MPTKVSFMLKKATSKQITLKLVIIHHNVYHSVFTHLYNLFTKLLSTVTNTCAVSIQIATISS